MSIEKFPAVEGGHYQIKYDSKTQTATFEDDIHGWETGMCLYVTVGGKKKLHIVHFVMVHSETQNEIAFLRPLSLKQRAYYGLSKLGIKLNIPSQK